MVRIGENCASLPAEMVAVEKIGSWVPRMEKFDANPERRWYMQSWTNQS
jgi:hypothetical protein